MEELCGTETILCCIVLFDVTAWVLCTEEEIKFWVVCIFVLDTLHFIGLVGIVGLGGLESVPEVTTLGGGFVCIISRSNVDGVSVSVVFCAGVNGCDETDGRSGKWDWNVNIGRALVIRPLMLVCGALGCWDMEEEVLVSYSGGGGGS